MTRWIAILLTISFLLVLWGCTAPKKTGLDIEMKPIDLAPGESKIIFEGEDTVGYLTNPGEDAGYMTITFEKKITEP